MIFSGIVRYTSWGTFSQWEPQGDLFRPLPAFNLAPLMHTVTVDTSTYDLRNLLHVP